MVSFANITNLMLHVRAKSIVGKSLEAAFLAVNFWLGGPLLSHWGHRKSFGLQSLLCSGLIRQWPRLS
jgi:hypothetical protein